MKMAQAFKRSEAREFVIRVLDNSTYDQPGDFDIEGMVTELTTANGGTYDLFMLDHIEFWDIADRHRVA